MYFGSRPLIILLSVVCFISACVPPSTFTRVSFDLNDVVVQKLLVFQNKQQLDSLVSYLTAQNPAHRVVAARAFGSIADTSRTAAYIPALGKLLTDPFDEVRQAAAFALGQIGLPQAEPLLIQHFDRNDSLGQYMAANREILEAVGKCGSLTSLGHIAAISTFQVADTMLLEGQALSILRFGQRNISSPEGNQTMLRLMRNPAHSVLTRTAAATHFARLEGYVPDSTALAVLSTALNFETDAGVQGLIARALGRSKDQRAVTALVAVYNRQKDARVRIQIVRALAQAPVEWAKTTWLAALRDSDALVAAEAGEIFINRGNEVEPYLLTSLANDNSISEPVRLKLTAAMFTHLPYKSNADLIDSVNTELKNRFAAEIAPYKKAQIIHTLAAFPFNYAWIDQQGRVATQHAAVKTAATEALKNIANHPLFAVLFKGRTKTVKEELVSALMWRINSADPGPQVVAAEAMRAPALLPYLRDSLSTLQTALNKLKLPRHVEVFDAFQKAIDAATGTVSPARKTDLSGTFNPKDLLALKRPLRVLVDTDKGKMTIELDPMSAPTGVLSFLRLAKTGYYDNKPWHRVVGSFVAQTGCSTGDGYSGMDFSLRSELSAQHYLKSGMVGLASAGAHTEGAQWFVTLAPALHLDGRYTILGQVVEGLDVAFQLLVGDSVKKVLVP